MAVWLADRRLGYPSASDSGFLSLFLILRSQDFVVKLAIFAALPAHTCLKNSSATLRGTFMGRVKKNIDPLGISPF
jgi:hypothetical protein